MYKVIKDFKDLTDNGYIYRAGDVFPRGGVEVEEYRLNQLSTNENVRKEVLIQLIENDDQKSGEGETNDFPKHTGGGYYQLSNGEKVQGKDAAIEAEKTLAE